MILVLSVCWVTIVAWLIYRAFRQRELLPVLDPNAAPGNTTAPDGAAPIAVIVPARDEAANINACLESLMRQDYARARLHIIVVDDHSTDATAAIVRAMLTQHADGPPRATLVSSPPLPPGWIGKSHACWIGAQVVPADTDWLCFIDADVRAEPALLSCAVKIAVGRSIDLLSLAPRQELGSFAERLILPCGLFLLAFRQDLRRKQAADRPDDVTVTGQCMLVRRAAYEAIGGHATIRDQICEDLELARVLKRSGWTVSLFGGDRLVSTRMYSGWRTLWPGRAKNLSDTFGGPVATLTTALLAVILAWCATVMPVAAAYEWAHGAQAAGLATGLATLASFAAFAFHVCGVRYFRIPFWYGMLFPLGYTIGALIAIDSLRLRLLGRVPWKGRAYPPPVRAAAGTDAVKASRLTSLPRSRSSAT